MLDYRFLGGNPMIDFMKDDTQSTTISPVSITALKPFDGKTVEIYLNGGMLFRSGQLNLSKAKFRVGLTDSRKSPRIAIFRVSWIALLIFTSFLSFSLSSLL